VEEYRRLLFASQWLYRISGRIYVVQKTVWAAELVLVLFRRQRPLTLTRNVTHIPR